MSCGAPLLRRWASSWLDISGVWVGGAASQLQGMSKAIERMDAAVKLKQWNAGLGRLLRKPK